MQRKYSEVNIFLHKDIVRYCTLIFEAGLNLQLHYTVLAILNERFNVTSFFKIHALNASHGSDAISK